MSTVFAFLENMAVSEDQEVKNLLQVTVLEYLRSWYLLQNRAEKLMLPETKKIFDRVKSYLQEPAQDSNLLYRNRFCFYENKGV